VQELNFLPKNYINRLKNRYLKVYLLIIIILFTSNAGMAYINYRKYIDYKNIKDKYHSEQIRISRENIVSNDKNLQKPNNLLVEEYYDILWRYNEQSFKEIEISEEDIRIKSLHGGLQQYIDFIKAIEKDKNLIIVDLHPPVLGESGIESQVVLNYIR
jgi:hypothetical protein